MGKMLKIVSMIAAITSAFSPHQERVELLLWAVFLLLLYIASEE